MSKKKNEWLYRVLCAALAVTLVSGTSAMTPISDFVGTPAGITAYAAETRIDNNATFCKGDTIVVDGKKNEKFLLKGYNDNNTVEVAIGSYFFKENGITVTPDGNGYVYSVQLTNASDPSDIKTVNIKSEADYGQKIALKVTGKAQSGKTTTYTLSVIQV